MIHLRAHSEGGQEGQAQAPDPPEARDPALFRKVPTSGLPLSLIMYAVINTHIKSGTLPSFPAEPQATQKVLNQGGWECERGAVLKEIPEIPFPPTAPPSPNPSASCAIFIVSIPFRASECFQGFNFSDNSWKETKL